MLRKSFFITCLLMFALFAICLVSCDDDNDDSEATATITYEVGKPGPTGGLVFYDKGEYSDGWRYLEAAPADLKIVAGAPTVDSSLSGYSSGTFYIFYGLYRTSAGGSELYVNGTTTYDSSNCTGTAIGTGKKNTELHVKAMGDETYKYDHFDYDNSDKISDYAARLCDILEYKKDGKTYADWFLPSMDELNQMYTNLKAKSLGDFADGYYWSSSETAGSTTGACGQYFSNGNPHNSVRNTSSRVRPVRAF